MTKTELRKYFQLLLVEELKKYNFSLNKQDSEFTRKTKHGWDKFQLIFLERKEGWEIDFGLLIRLHEIENIYHKGSYYEKKYQNSTPTVGISIENYLNDGNVHRLNIKSIDDANIFYTDVIKYFEEIAIPFFDKYSSIEELDKAINVKEGKSIFSGLKYSGSLGIILAGLNNNVDFIFFEKKYREYYKTFCKGFYLKEFEDILKEIKLINPAISSK